MRNQDPRFVVCIIPFSWMIQSSETVHQQHERTCLERGQHTFVTVVQWVCCKSRRLTNQPAAVAHGYWTFLDGQSKSIVRDKAHFMIFPFHWGKSERAITEYSFTETPLKHVEGLLREDVCRVFCKQSIESYRKLNTLQLENLSIHLAYTEEVWITKCILLNFNASQHKYCATSYSVMPVLLVVCPYFCISLQ